MAIPPRSSIAPPPSAEVIAQVFETITDEGSGDIRACEANTIIYDEGSVDNCMFILRNGTVGMYDENRDLISELKPVSLFGEMGMLTGDPREATAVAATDDTYVEVITPDYLEAIFNACPVKIELILRQLSYRLRVLNYDVITTCKEITEAYNK